jgi:predicted dehydrogenase
MINVGIAGIGFMGWIHYLAYQRVRGVRVAAICEQDKKRLSGDWRDIQGNFGPRGTKIDVSQMARYDRLEDLVADPNLDLIDVCLPPAAHPSATIQALKSGKHVFCEKPMALTTADCRRMVQTAERAGRMLMIGHVLPMFPEYSQAYKLITSGKYGKLLGGHFKRVISDPLWLKDFYDPQRVGGPLLDLHIHDAHLIRLLFGMPESLVSQGRMRGQVVEFCNTMFRFADPSLVVSATSGVINQQGRPFTHGFEIYLEKATLLFESAVLGGEGVTLMPLTILDSRGKAVRPKLGEHDEISPFVGEIKEVLTAVKSGTPSEILGGELARDAIILCHKQTDSVRKGRPVKI